MPNKIVKLNIDFVRLVIFRFLQAKDLLTKVSLLNKATRKLLNTPRYTWIMSDGGRIKRTFKITVQNALTELLPQQLLWVTDLFELDLRFLNLETGQGKNATETVGRQLVKFNRKNKVRK